MERKPQMKKTKKVETPSEDLVEDEELEVIEPEIEDPEPVIKLSEEEILQKEVKKLEEQLEVFKGEALKARADSDNFKKRLQRDHELSQKYRIQSFAIDILPALDNLERAMAEESKDGALLEGVQMTYNQLKSSLEKEGVKAIEALNLEFDPNIHQAISTKKVEGVKENIVVEEFQKGYMIKDRILRPSIVIVSE